MDTVDEWETAQAKKPLLEQHGGEKGVRLDYSEEGNARAKGKKDVRIWNAFKIVELYGSCSTRRHGNYGSWQGGTRRDAVRYPMVDEALITAHYLWVGILRAGSLSHSRSCDKLP